MAIQKVKDPIALIQTAGDTYEGVPTLDQTYIINDALISAGSIITIIDQGDDNDKIELAPGLTIVSSIIANDEALLTLNNGTQINIRGASSFGFVVGGNTAGGVAGEEKTYQAFVEDTLGLTFPDEGTAEGGEVEIPGTEPPAPAVPTFSIMADSPVAEGETATYTITLSSAQVAATTVDYAVTLDGATADDHGSITVDGVADSPASGTITFAAGETSKTITIPFLNDDISPEDNESVTITLSNPAGGPVVSETMASAEVEIQDVPTTFALTASAENVFEGASLTYTITASTAVAEDTVVAFSVVAGDPVGPDFGTNNTNLNDFDQGAFNPSNVTIAAGQTTATFVLNTKEDTITELTEGYVMQAVVRGETVTLDTTLLDGNGSGGKTFTLTTGNDDVPGTSGNDTIIGGALAPDGVTSANTLNALDVINGGDGIDTLILDTTGDKNNLTGSITSVENLYLIGGSAAINGDIAIDMTNYSGQFKLQQTSDTAVTLSNVTGQTVMLDRVADTTKLTAGYAAAQTSATLSNTAAVGDATFSVSGTGLATVNLSTDKTATGKSVTVTDTGDTTKTANITATAAAAVSVGSKALETVTLSGAGAVTLTAATAPSKALDASGSTGGITYAVDLVAQQFTGSSAKDTVQFGATTKAQTLGGGDDVATISAGPATGGSINAGDGTDTLQMTAAVADGLDNSTSFNATISNFEKLSLTAATNQTLNLTNLGGFDYVTAAGDGNTLTIQNLVSGGTFVFADASTATAIALKDSTGTSDVLNVGIAGTAAINAGTLTANGVETVNFMMDDTNKAPAGTVEHTLVLTNPDVKTIAVSGDAGLILTHTASTKVTSFDASGMTVASTAAGADAKGVNWTTGALADSFATTANGTTTVNVKGSDGVDTIDASAVVDTTVNLTIDGGLGGKAGATGDTITGGAGADTITVSGLGNHTIDAKSGTDTINVNAGKATINNAGVGQDTIHLNTTGNADVVKFVAANVVGATSSISGFEAGTSTTAVDKIDVTGTAWSAAAEVRQSTAAAATDASLVVLDGQNYSTLADALLAADALHHNAADKDYLVVWNDGSNLHVSFATQDAAIEVATDQIVDLVTLTGVSIANIDLTDFTFSQQVGLFDPQVI